MSLQINTLILKGNIMFDGSDDINIIARFQLTITQQNEAAFAELRELKDF